MVQFSVVKGVFMDFRHQLSYVSEEALVFLFKHNDEVGVDALIDQWQQQEVEQEITVMEGILQFTIILTRISRMLIDSGMPAYPVLGKMKFAMNIAFASDTLEKLHKHERRQIHEFFHAFELNKRKTDNLVVNHILDYLYVRLHGKVSLDDMAHSLKMSKSHLSHVFKQVMDESIMSYYQRIKIERSEFFLKCTEDSILDIAMLLGFNDQSHFTKTFKSVTGYTPKAYRLEHS